jgi:hypothetical protein
VINKYTIVDMILINSFRSGEEMLNRAKFNCST